ncbi:DUF192 domain-containing protein [Streptomyces vilmorinianum]|uniref:DUF192 domain-containing protein n=1 Tax=Streptomyces vilmorinianum TaxID=3051092 RepID=UPI0010FB393D|nr:DUF192 domain-containing protein [Streptomyces vilmorinianum]
MGRPGKWRDGAGTLTVEQAVTVPEAVPLEPVPLEAVPLEIAASYRSRRRGLLGRDGITGALLLTPANSIHTFGMRFAIDVAYLDRAFRVLDVVTMRPGRLGMLRLRARHVLEAEGGAMAGWGLWPGAEVRVTVAPSRGE